MSDELSALIQGYADALKAAADEAGGQLAVDLRVWSAKVVELTGQVVLGALTLEQAVSGAQSYADAAKLTALAVLREQRAAQTKALIDLGLKVLAVVAAA